MGRAQSMLQRSMSALVYTETYNGQIMVSDIAYKKVWAHREIPLDPSSTGFVILLPTFPTY